MRKIIQNKTTLIALLLLMLLPLGAEAKVRLPGFFNDHMVLQRDIAVPIWGWADPGEEVTVEFSPSAGSGQAGQKKTVKTDKDGKWMVKLNAMKANDKGSTLVVRGQKTEDGGQIEINDVVVGEVWLCSGQSNMGWPLEKALNAEQEVKDANYPLIRNLNVQKTAAYLPNTDAHGEWTVCTPETAGKYTAVGYFFARKLYEELKIPIGFIDAAWGGTGIEPWIPEIGYRMVPELQKNLDELSLGLPTSEKGKDKWNVYLSEIEAWLPGAKKQVAESTLPVNIPKRPSKLPATHHGMTKIFNAVINPLIPYGIRGAIWYQGESSWGMGPQYFYMKKGLIEGWRTLWNQPQTSDRTMPGRDFSFYTVQLANLHPYNPKPEGGEGYPRIREAQRKCLELKNNGLAVIYDIGMEKNIHPVNKQDVGARLALWALAKDYGQKDLVYSGPLYEKIEIKGSEAVIHFTCTGSGLMAGKKEGLEPTKEVKSKLEGFAIAGNDKVWQWADAKIGPKGKTLIVSSDKVKEPVAVRYAYRWNPIKSNLYNKEGLPASPFRTDDW